MGVVQSAVSVNLPTANAGVQDVSPKVKNRLVAAGRFGLVKVGGGLNLPSSDRRDERPVHSET